MVLFRSTATQSSTKVTQADLKRYACTRGIRSIPYLIISNTCNTNAGAIHLSSMLSMQRSTQQLLEFLPPGKTGGLPDTAGQCKGIIWLPNEMDMVAKKMLDMGEAIRKLTSGDSDSDEEQDEPRRSSTGSESQDDTTSPCRDHASQRKMQKHLESEYRRVTKRVRMETLKNVSVHEVELWSTAIKMLVVARALLLDDGDRVDKTSPESSPQEEVTDEQELEHKDSSAELVEMFQHYPLTASIDSFEPVPSNYDIEFPAICVTKPDGEVMELIEAVSKTSTPTPTATSDPQPAPRQRKGIARSHSSTTAAQKVSGPGGLAIETWRAIIEEVVDGKGILTRGQQMQIIRYASDWDVIAYKMTIQGVEDYQQIWKFLETVGCFTYSPESQ